MQAIETTYHDQKFRSRLEARWGVLFDALDIRWEYEKEGFNLGNGLFYLPDFWLPDHQCWFEVKGADPSDDEVAKAVGLATLTGFPCFMAIGEMLIPTVTDTHVTLRFEDYGEHPNKFGWSECPVCKSIALCLEGVCTELPCGCTRVLGDWLRAKKLMASPTISEYGRQFHETMRNCLCTPSPRIIAAYTSARMARFEHGRSGN